MTPDTITVTQIHYLADLLKQAAEDVENIGVDAGWTNLTTAEAVEQINAIMAKLNEAAK